LLQSILEEKSEYSPDELNKKSHGAVICYPGTNLSSFESRVDQLKSLRVSKLIFAGNSKVGRLGIIGRGCVSIVVKARLESEREPVALKIRRVDADRTDMRRDFELQCFANTFGVGPRAISSSADLFSMEYIDSTKLGNWFARLRTRSPKIYTGALIRNALEQCFLLDSHGLDHGELSNPTKHVLIRNNGKPETVIIDYESASRGRRVSNLTSVSQFFFMSSSQSKKVRKILGFTRFSEKKLISLLREYKVSPSETSLKGVFEFLRI
jgi:putative serine/threonine protein kinase